MVDQERKTEMKKQEEANVKEREMVADAKAKVEKPEKEELPKVEKEEIKEIKSETPKVEKKEITSSDSEKSEASKDAEQSSVKEKKVETPSGEKKTSAIVNGSSLHISTKHAIAICNFIKGKNIEKAIVELEDAEKMKFAIPMRGEIPHKKGMMSGRYPVKALGEFVKLLKSLKSNAIANELELEKVRILCKANVASRPYRRFGRKRFKRTHVEIKLEKKLKKSGGKK